MPSEPVHLTINGTEVPAEPGRLLIDVAEALGIFVPRFCYHPGMDSVAACRMCLVEVAGQRKLLPACATQVTEGMVVRTDSQAAIEAQKSVLELLLINHPLDCPICDRGGECPLQDQALGFGPGASRYHEQKRHFRKALPLSKLVTLDRERCVLCWRCVRFCREVSGDTEIELLDRGSLSQINTGPAAPFDSHFSGNTIQICPVGALTATPYRFQSRPWDLVSTASVCSFCAVGCPLSVERRGDEVLRAQALPNDEVNSFWNCDKGRYGHRYVSHRDRLSTPLVRRPGPDGDTFEDTSWMDALSLVTERLRRTVDDYGPEAVGFIGGSHATNEDLYAAQLLFREAVGTPNLDFRTFDAAFDYAAFAAGGVVGSSARIDDLDSARTILWYGGDPKEELPVLYLRLRSAVRRGATLLVAHPRRISLCDFGLHLAFTPGREADLFASLLGGGTGGAASGVSGEALQRAVTALGAEKVVLCAGPQFPGTARPLSWQRFRSLADRLASDGRGSVLLCVPNANSQGALDFGIYPGLGPGQRPAPAGLGTLGMLEAAAADQLKFLWVLGADLVSDVPDAALASAALRSGVFVVVSELFATPTALSADVVLPAASFAEKEGSFTNLERRIQKTNPIVGPPGAARADWQVFLDIARRLGHPHTLTSEAMIASEVARQLPTHAGFSWDHLGDPWSPLSGPSDMPPELGHGSGESGPLPARRSQVSQEPGTLHLQLARPTTAWPLRWELRAVDATRRRGWVWSGPAGGGPAAPDGPAEPAAAPPADGELVLLLGREIYDDGAMVSRSPELRSVTLPAFVELHPADAARLGLAEGAPVTVRTGSGSVPVALRVSDHTPAGCAYLPFEQPGAHANALVTAGASLTYARVEGAP